ncbi:MAG: hypothetical protein QOH81_358 [Sphingomonadales bacterium]|jgi:hypothetical protein|nr:hypothetical protein [Sphingomonadales bacterium]
MMAVPSLMICLTLLLPARASRALNLATGLLYTAIIAVTGLGGWSFILFLSLVEMVLTALIVGTAWRWPRRASAG